MGQIVSCGGEAKQRDRFWRAVQRGDASTVQRILLDDPSMVNEAKCLRRRRSSLHVAALNGNLQVLEALLEQGARLGALDRYGKTPLMVACKKGNWACAIRLLDEGAANVLLFASSRGRTCLHYAAAKPGNEGCVEKILEVARVADSRGVASFVNATDTYGLTALHFASIACNVAVVRLLLIHGASESVGTLPCCQYNGLGGGRTPLHFAARGGSVDCVQELLVWGADGGRRDNEGQTAYGVAIAYENTACAILLKPSSASRVTYASPLKLMKELEPEAKHLLAAALRKEQSRQSEVLCDSGKLSQPSSQEQLEEEACSICMERVCTMELSDCGHRMCAFCIVKLCCHCAMSLQTRDVPPSCPFCRRRIVRLGTL